MAATRNISITVSEMQTPYGTRRTYNAGPGLEFVVYLPGNTQKAAHTKLFSDCMSASFKWFALYLLKRLLDFVVDSFVGS
ncbi:MAG: hypothetical protein H6818_05345 [Phycisphaerales bacterium]|nr:hypothetical protein [Phycisphaerales bacterium]MCB9863390.1 hypothetical protein [Phycisphaerales bacterium]